VRLRNSDYRITFSSLSGRFYYYFAKDDGWYQITALDHEHRTTPEQVLNHVLPALAHVKPNVAIKVTHLGSNQTNET
jgi:hypothetical protein